MKWYFLYFRNYTYQMSKISLSTTVIHPKLKVGFSTRKAIGFQSYVIAKNLYYFVASLAILLVSHEWCGLIY